MNDSDKIRSVVARFFAVAESTVTEAFVFPRDRLQGSVGRTTLHAALKRMAGADLPSAFTADTFGELVGTTPLAQDGTKASEERAGDPASSSRAPSVERNRAKSLPGPPSSVGLGIDIESADNLPWSGDPRSEPFYVENFTGAEIAYCVRQADPRLSFCGLWCAKEAAIKCGQDFAGLRPIEIEIHHNETGRPMLQKAGAAHSVSDGQVSISHAGPPISDREEREDAGVAAFSPAADE